MLPHKQLVDDLRGEFRGPLHVDAPTRALYATDASPFHVTPHAVAVPLDERDVRTLLRYAHEHALPVIPRGAGTGVAGESLGPGLVMDLSVHLRGISEVTGDTVRAQAGVVLANLNAVLARHGRRFAPDPASAATCTVGGVVGTNASGPNLFAHGYAREHVRALRVAWDDGEAATVSGTRAAPAAAPLGLRTIEVRAQAAALLSEHRELIQIVRPQTPFTRAGYQLHDALTPAGLDLTRLLVGSEGTLAVTLEAELKTIPLAGGTAAFALGFESLAEAVRAGLTLRAAEGIVACDVFDQRLLSVAAAYTAAGAMEIPTGVAAVLTGSVEDDSPGQAEALATGAVTLVRDSFTAAVLLPPTAGEAERAAVARFHRAAVAAQSSTGATGLTPATAFEDTALPGEDLVRYLAAVSELLRRSELPGVLHVRPLVGQLDIRPLVDLRKPADRAALWPLADRVHALAIAAGGTVGSRHGTGLARTPWAEKQFGPMLPVFVELKRIFDPKGLLNPGKVVAPDPGRPAWPLREADVEPPKPRVPLLVWPDGGPAAEASRCSGCGDCRENAPPVRMCPTFHVTKSETAAPRAHANLARFLASADTDDAAVLDRVKEVAANCVNCKMCRGECPSRVDIPRLALEARGEHHAAQGPDRDQWVLARVGRLVRLAGLLPGLANVLLGSRAARWAIEKVFGVSRRRTLPRLVWRSFMTRARRAGLCDRPTGPPPPGGRVAVFAGGFADRLDPQAGEAAVAVLRHHGVQVYVPPRQRGSGDPAVLQGNLDAARDAATRTVRLLVGLVRDGYEVVCLDPRSAVTITQDYPALLADADAALVAAATHDLTAFLARLHRAGGLRTDFPRPLDLSLGHHVPCHAKALGGEAAGPLLLSLIPGVRVEAIDRSCSGMAGVTGLRAKGYEVSLTAGRPTLDALADPSIRYGSSECGACRVQLQEGSGKRALHPVVYLAYAYGLMPSVAKRLARPLGKLVTG